MVSVEVNEDDEVIEEIVSLFLDLKNKLPLNPLDVLRMKFGESVGVVEVGVLCCFKLVFFTFSSQLHCLFFSSQAGKTVKNSVKMQPAQSKLWITRLFNINVRLFIFCCVGTLPNQLFLQLPLSFKMDLADWPLFRKLPQPEYLYIVEIKSLINSRGCRLCLKHPGPLCQYCRH